MGKAKTIKRPEPVKPAESLPRRKEKVTGVRRDYVSTEVYEEGDLVYHKVWDDVGEVVEIGLTDDGIRKMKVSFEKVGVKYLCMSLATTDSGSGS